jgi:hypothetical protein
VRESVSLRKRGLGRWPLADDASDTSDDEHAKTLKVSIVNDHQLFAIEQLNYQPSLILT